MDLDILWMNESHKKTRIPLKRLGRIAYDILNVGRDVDVLAVGCGTNENEPRPFDEGSVVVFRSGESANAASELRYVSHHHPEASEGAALDNPGKGAIEVVLFYAITAWLDYLVSA